MVRVYACPSGTRPRRISVLRLASSLGPLRIRSALLGCTVVSRSPWKTMVGTDAPAVPIGPALPCRIAANADGRSLAAPPARREGMPTAAYRWGYVAPMMAAAAPPADRPAT